MGYTATVKNFDLRVTNRAGMLDYLNEQLKMAQSTPMEDPYTDLEDAMKSFYCSDFIRINPDGTVGDLSIVGVKYDEKYWKPMARFLSGYIEWVGEDYAMWRDYFRAGEFYSKYPSITWYA